MFAFALASLLAVGLPPAARPHMTRPAPTAPALAAPALAAPALAAPAPPAQAPTAPPSTTTPPGTAPAGTPTTNAHRQILILDLRSVGVAPEKTTLLNGRLAGAVAARGYDALSGTDLRAMASLAAEQSTVGCDAESQACLADIAAALGAQLVVSGQVGQLDDVFLVQLALFDADAGRVVSRAEARGRSLTATADALPGAVAALLPGGAVVDGAGPAAVARVSSSPSTLALVGAATAVVGGIGCAGLGIWAWVLDESLAERDPDAKQRAFALQTEPAVLIGAGVGGVAAVVGGALLVAGTNE